MLYLLIILAFALFVLYDYNQINGNGKLMRTFFFLGVSIIVGSTMYALINSNQAFVFIAPMRTVFYLLCALSFSLLIYTLFFAIPFDDAYIKGSKQEICTTGVYSLCRHPGALFLSGTYLFGGLAVGITEILWMCLVISICNLIYIIYQDKYTFPKLFDKYEEYRKTTPFLIPNFQKHEEKHL